MPRPRSRSVAIDENQGLPETIASPDVRDFRGQALPSPNGNNGMSGGGNGFVPPGFPQHAPPTIGVVAFPPPMVTDAHPQAVQHTVKWLDNGRPQDLGNIDVRATSHDLVRKWNRSGTFQLMPVDMAGNPLEQRPHVVEIDPGHEAFRAVVATSPQSPIPGAPSASDPLAVTAIVKAALEPMQAHVAMLGAQLAETQRAAAEAQRQLFQTMEATSKERLALAMREGSQVSSQFEKLNDREAQRVAAAQQQMMSMFSAMSGQTQEQFARHMAQTQQAADAERERLRDQYTRDMERERVRRVDEEAARIAKATQEAEARRRDEEDRERRWEKERERDREFHERTLTLIKAQNTANDPQAMVQKTIDMVAGAAGKLGIDLGKFDLMSLVGKFVGGGPTTIPEIIAQTVQAIVNGVVEVKKLEADSAVDDADDVIEVPIADPQTGQVTVQIVPRAQYDAMVAQAKAGPQPVGAIPQTQGAAPQPQSASPAAVQAQASQAQASAVAHLDPGILKAARGALRNLVATLQSEKDKSKWSDAVKSAVMKEPQAILQFVRAVSIRGALKESGADDTLASAVISIIEDSGLVPADVPR